MYEIPLKYRELIDAYKPIDFEGIKLYPIKVRDHAIFANARPAIEIVQQSLPVRYVSMPLLSAFYAMDVEAYLQGTESEGLFWKTILFIALATRFREDLPPDARIKEFESSIYTKEDDPATLSHIELEQDGRLCKITPVLFQRMRVVLAAQNGIELTPENANPELLEAKRDLLELNGPKMDFNFQSLLSTIATLSGVAESDIYDWPILMLNRRQKSYSRVMSYLIYGLASATGAKFTGGNPVPSPYFDRLDLDSGALVDMQKVTGGRQVSVSTTHPSETNHILPNEGRHGL